MLICAYLWLSNLLPGCGRALLAVVYSFMPIVITLGGILMLLSIVGIRVSNNLGSTIVGGIFRAIGYLVRTIFNAAGWLIRGFFHCIPRVYNGSRRMFGQMHLNAPVSNILAGLLTLLFIAIII